MCTSFQLMQLHMLLKDIMRDIRDTNILENHATVLRNSLWVLRGYKYFVFLLEIFKALGTYQSNGNMDITMHESWLKK